MLLTVKRMFGIVVLVLGWMIAAHAHQPAEAGKSVKLPAPVAATHVKTNADDAGTTKSEKTAPSNSAATEALLPQTEPKEGGGGCLRASCNCTSSNHGNPYCSTTGGDCPNHPGLLCIWP